MCPTFTPTYGPMGVCCKSGRDRAHHVHRVGPLHSWAGGNCCHFALFWPISARPRFRSRERSLGHQNARAHMGSTTQCVACVTSARTDRRNEYEWQRGERRKRASSFLSLFFWHKRTCRRSASWHLLGSNMVIGDRRAVWVRVVLRIGELGSAKGALWRRSPVTARQRVRHTTAHRQA